MKKVLKGIGRFLDAAVLGGAIKNLKSDTPDSPRGHIDWQALIGHLTTIILLIAFLMGKIDQKTLEELTLILTN